jgi:hypothetical protein
VTVGVIDAAVSKVPALPALPARDRRDGGPSGLSAAPPRADASVVNALTQSGCELSPAPQPVGRAAARAFPLADRLLAAEGTLPVL